MVNGDLAEVFMQLGFLDRFIFFNFDSRGLEEVGLVGVDAVADIII